MLLMAAQPAWAGVTETVLYNFAGTPDGGSPQGNLTFHNGNLYGTTVGGGVFGQGSVFQLSPNGGGGWNETVIYSFCAVGSYPSCTDGANPYYASVIFDSLGNLYGTTWTGGVVCDAYGTYGCGVVYELSPSESGWTETVLYSFLGSAANDGAFAENGLIMDAQGNLYGTTGYEATVFELSPSGGGWTEQVLYNGNTEFSGVTMDGSGNIYGVGYNAIFELSPNGGGWNSKVIHTFTGGTKDGLAPQGNLVLDKAGNIYGTTTAGGKTGYGTVYKLTPVTSGKKKGTWTEKLLCSFKGGTKDGSFPYAGIVLDGAGNIYGNTEFSGKNGVGTVYELGFTVSTGKYKEKVLWNFNYTDGANPLDSLILDGGGNLYGTAGQGGSSDAGVVFEVTP